MKRAVLWAFALLPLAGLVELGAHVYQTRRVVPEEDWQAARELVSKVAAKEDLVTFAPAWTRPIGRHVFGDELATLDRVARGDASRFRRAFEVSIRGKHDRELSSWRTTDERRAGRITVRTLENPWYAPIKDDLLSHVGPDGMSVVRRDERGEETPCRWTQGHAQAGGLGSGPATPRDRFVCPGANVFATVVADLDYEPRRCLYAPPPGKGELVITFHDVKFGQVLRGHHGLYVEAERNREGADVQLLFRAGDRFVGRVFHRDGEGWKQFELPTHDLAGTSGELTAYVSAKSSNRRMYCFEGITR